MDNKDISKKAKEDKQAPQDSNLYHHRSVKKTRIPSHYRSIDNTRLSPSSASNSEPPALVGVMRIFLFILFALLLLFIAVKLTHKQWNSKIASQKAMSASKKQHEQNNLMPSLSLNHTQFLQRVPTLNNSPLRKAVSLEARGNSLYEEQKFHEAARCYQQALDSWPELTHVWFSLGRAFFQIHAYDKAQNAFEMMVHHDPVNVEVLNYLALSQLYQNLVNDALHSFLRLITLQDYPDVYYHTALCYLLLHEYDSARVMLKKHLVLQANDAKALREFAYVEARQANFEKALSLLETAIHVEPTWPVLYIDAAASSAFLDKIEEAFGFLEKGLEHTTPNEIYQAYQQPAFEQLHQHILNDAFEKKLVAYTKSLMRSNGVSESHSKDTGPGSRFSSVFVHTLLKKNEESGIIDKTE